MYKTTKTHARAYTHTQQARLYAQYLARFKYNIFKSFGSTRV